jgi:hypothetical protein
MRRGSRGMPLSSPLAPVSPFVLLTVLDSPGKRAEVTRRYAQWQEWCRRRKGTCT